MGDCTKTQDSKQSAASSLIALSPYYQHAGVTIYNGDSAQVIPSLGRFDLLLTDPKYGIGADAAAAKNKGRWGWKDYGKTNWDEKRTPTWLLEMALEKCDEGIIWGGNYFTDCLPPTMGRLVWNKMLTYRVAKLLQMSNNTQHKKASILCAGVSIMQKGPAVKKLRQF